jgi:cytochrome P450
METAEQLDTAIRLFGGTMMSPVPDPYPVYRRLRQEQPAVPMRGLLGTTWLVTRYDDVLAGLKDGKRFSARGNARGIGLVMGRTILEMESAEHQRHRKIVTPFFSLRALRGGVEQIVVDKVHGLIDGFAGSGEADLVSALTFTFPLRVMAEIIGIPIEDFEQFHRWALDLVSISDDPQRGFDAAARIVDYLKPVMAERRREPRNDLLSALTHAEVDGERLSEEEVLSFLRLLLPAGAETTYRLTGSTLFALLTHPEVLEAVRADRRRVDAVIEETLRWESPVQYTSREATVRVDFDGCEVPEGGLIMFAVGSANRDERHWERPDDFVLDRPNLGDHLAFGFGEHYCAGSFLGRLEARVAVNALLDRLPNLRLASPDAATMVGLAFRSPDRLPVVFDPQ